jgi:hypothetical protein
MLLVGFSLLFNFVSCTNDLSKLFGNWNPQGDWRYSLTCGYEILRTNSTDICLGKKVRENNYKTVIDSYITCFSYNDHYIAVRKLDVPQDYKQNQILQMNFEEAAYYLVDSLTEQIYGPYNIWEDFDSKCEELGVDVLCDWINTYPAPEGAQF